MLRSRQRGRKDFLAFLLQTRSAGVFDYDLIVAKYHGLEQVWKRFEDERAENNDENIEGEDGVARLEDSGVEMIAAYANEEVDA
ncbi:hypothetical protein LTR36_004049 [Oleoguttula mirabilis]|uniref:Uncharacterized protein n=1 Tax=Oleoguttula mirabilis TaxID=1507867 RepID=A0AAV9JHD8_9PEZI|nr:hypothetical protein LTR36_004049 [Oleoguttula mirabilis]